MMQLHEIMKKVERDGVDNTWLVNTSPKSLSLVSQQKKAIKTFVYQNHNCNCTVNNLHSTLNFMKLMVRTSALRRVGLYLLCMMTFETSVKTASISEYITLHLQGAP